MALFRTGRTTGVTALLLIVGAATASPPASADGGPAAGDPAPPTTPTTSAPAPTTAPPEPPTGAPTQVGPQPVELTVPRKIRADYLLGASVTVRVSPVDYSGRISVRDGKGRLLGSASATSGSAELTLTADRLGKFRVRVAAAELPGFTAAHTRSTIVSRGVALERNSRHAVVIPLLRRLRQLNYVTPEPSRRYSKRVGDVVLALQKVHGLPRTAELDGRTWRTLAEAEAVKPRHRTPGRHIEVDKTRQILMLVVDGKVRGTIHVSTGKTGNTPEGRFRVYAKGVGSLYRFMPFHGNFGIHGYVPVPPQPASHGCVREPMWAADWTYRRTRVGTPVIIYR